MLMELSKMEQRYEAVLGVIRDGLQVTEVAEAFGVGRQTVLRTLGAGPANGALADGRVGRILMEDGTEDKVSTGQTSTSLGVMHQAKSVCYASTEPPQPHRGLVSSGDPGRIRSGPDVSCSGDPRRRSAWMSEAPLAQ